MPNPNNQENRLAEKTQKAQRKTSAILFFQAFKLFSVPSVLYVAKIIAIFRRILLSVPNTIPCIFIKFEGLYMDFERERRISPIIGNLF